MSGYRSHHIVEDAVGADGEWKGVLGFHFTYFEGEDSYRAELEKVSRYLLFKGVTAFWCTIPTVSTETVKKVCCPRPRCLAWIWISHFP